MALLGPEEAKFSKTDGDIMKSIRRLRREDNLGELLALCKEFFAEYESHHEEFFDTDDLTDDDLSGRFQESIDSETGATFVALSDGKIVGYCSVAVREQPKFYKIKKVGAIWALMVAGDYRRRGIAGRLLNEAKKFLRDHGIKYFTLYMAAGNKDALEFYRRHGLKPLHVSYLGES